MQAAIVGTGFMGWVHIEALRRIGVTVAGVVGASPEKARQMANRFCIPKYYDSYDELLADSGVDVVHIVTPNRLHHSMVQKALKADKHVLCEKPLAMNSRESAELVELARTHDHLVTAVNYNIRFYPLCVEAQQRISRGDVGEVFHIAGSYVQDWLLKRTDYNWRVLSEESGQLRAVADIGTHWLDLIQHLTGAHVVELCADLSTVHPVRERPKGEVETFQSTNESAASETESIAIRTEDCASVLLKFDSGVRGCLHVSQVTAGRKNCLRFEIAGSKQSLAWDSERPNELWIGFRDQPNEVLLRDPALLSEAGRATTNYPGGHNEGYDDSFKQAFRAFYAAIEQPNDSPPVRHATFDDGHREIVLCEAIQESHRKRSWVQV